MSTEETKKESFFKSTIWKVSLVESTIIIFLATFRWQIFEIITPFLGIFLILICFITLIVSIIVVLTRTKQYKLKILLPLFFYLIAFYSLVFDPLSGALLNLNFNANKKERENIVRLIHDGKLEVKRLSDTHGLVNLPSNKTGLSSGGRVNVAHEGENMRVLFYTYTGVLDNFSGFIYTEVQNNPSPESVGCEPVQVIKKTPNWYWVSCT